MVQSNRRRLAGLVALVFLALACTGGERPSESIVSAPPDAGTPRLVLFLVVDQCRADYLERFRPLLRFGLDRLLRESVVFTDALHDHAWTKTAPGHATLVTGAHPSRHGIVSNDWFDLESGEMIDSDTDGRWSEGRSPHRLAVPTLSDRMKERWPDSKAFGASGKSRGAILPAGRLADRAFWIEDEIGRFVTSTYYGEEPPAWLAEFHADPLPDRIFGGVWEPLPETQAAGPDYDIQPIDRSLVYAPLPRTIGRASVYPNEAYHEDFYWTPFSDAYLLELAQTLILEEGLGDDAYPDFLGLSFSALDLVGHAFGPDSPEMLDTFLRLDRTLGELLDFIDLQVGLDNVLVSLSADHGVSPVPEVSQSRGYTARRFGLEENRCMQSVPAQLDAELGRARWFLEDLVLNPEAATEVGVPMSEVEVVAKRLIEACPSVERVWTATELAAADGGDDPMMRLYRNNFYAGRSPSLMVQWQPWSVALTGHATTHGSPYPYDTRVPWLVRLPSGEGRLVGEPVKTVDVAPTLAVLMDIDLGAEIDGVDRSSLLAAP